MGKHTAPPMIRREYGRNVTTYPVTSTYTEPPLDRVHRVLEDYRTTMALLNLDADEYLEDAHLVIGPKLNSWQQYRTLGWYLDADAHDGRTPF